jgi:SAM-dependent methyltransferase
MSDRERPADCDRQWLGEPMNLAAPAEEARTPRWQAQEDYVRATWGGFEGLRVIEIGAGRGTNAALYAQRGADVTIFDTSPVALEQARELFVGLGLDADYVAGDAFNLASSLRDSFDVSMSFGLWEHFLDDRRRAIVAAHLDVLRPGGVAFLGVPNRWAPVYRLWMGTLKRTGSWPLGTEVPFTSAELAALVREAGGEPLGAQYGSFVASAVSHGVNQLLFKLGRQGLPVPQVRIPLLDTLAYELLLPARRP